MKIKSRISALLLFCFAMIVLANHSFAQETKKEINQEITLEGMKIPLMPMAKDVWGGERNLEINGVSAKGYAFLVEKPLEQIVSFYQTELTKQGWQFFQEWEQLNIRLFIKDGKYLYIAGGAFLVEGAMYGGKDTRLALIVTKTPLRLCLLTDEIFKSESPGRDLSFIPRYPGSTRTLSVIREDKEGMFIYISHDAPAKVVDFYLKKLPAYGWKRVQSLTLPRTCANAAISISALVFERPSKDPVNKTDNLLIYTNYCADYNMEIIGLVYNIAFNYSASK